jgi:hypothetical protein
MSKTKFNPIEDFKPSKKVKAELSTIGKNFTDHTVGILESYKDATQYFMHSTALNVAGGVNPDEIVKTYINPDMNYISITHVKRLYSVPDLHEVQRLADTGKLGFTYAKLVGKVIVSIEKKENEYGFGISLTTAKLAKLIDKCKNIDCDTKAFEQFLRYEILGTKRPDKVTDFKKAKSHIVSASALIKANGITAKDKKALFDLASSLVGLLMPTNDTILPAKTVPVDLSKLTKAELRQQIASITMQ